MGVKFRCPRCKSTKEFEKTLVVVQVFDGRGDMITQHEKDCTSNDPPSMECCQCGYIADASDFDLQRQTCETCVLAEDHCEGAPEGRCDRWQGSAY